MLTLFGRLLLFGNKHSNSLYCHCISLKTQQTMLKRLFIASIMLATVTFSFGQGKALKGGFFINVGVGFPSQTGDLKTETTQTPVVNGIEGVETPVKKGTDVSSQTLGVLPHVELGNQWYFFKTDKFGIGLRASWIQFGISSFTYSPSIKFNDGTGTLNSEIKGGLYDVRLIKLAPQFTYAITEDMALDFSFEVSPTIAVHAGRKGDDVFLYTGAGLLYAPGIKFRYNIFAVGFDYGFGSLSTAGGFTDLATTVKSVTTYTGRISVGYPRIYAGFKF